jgi:hypothetical protein
VIKGLFLPNGPRPIQMSIDQVSGCSFDGLGDACKRNYLGTLRVNQRREDHVHVIRHHHDHVQIHFDEMFMKTTIEDNTACTLGKNPSAVSSEGQKVMFEVSLEMRKIATIKRLWHTNSHSDGDSPVEQDDGQALSLWLG